MNFKVIFELDGTGIYYDPNEPPHLDALLVWALAPMQTNRRDIGRSDTPDDIKIPLLRSTIHGVKVWHASALFQEHDGVETLRSWRKKFDQSRIHLTKGSPNLTRLLQSFESKAGRRSLANSGARKTSTHAEAARLAMKMALTPIPCPRIR